MGLRLIYGKTGTGKSSYCFSEISKLIENEENIYFITPEQFSFTAEKKLMDFLKEKAESGESFVVLGRCASYVLRDYDCLIKVFVTSDMHHKMERIASIEHLDPLKVEDLIIKNNKKRKTYHNYYSKEKWGDSRYYDLIISTSKVGIDGAFDVVSNYVKKVIDE